jgi:hypothetical protein
MKSGGNAIIFYTFKCKLNVLESTGHTVFKLRAPTVELDVNKKRSAIFAPMNGLTMNNMKRMEMTDSN